MELSYTSLPTSRFNISTLGVTAASFSAAFFILPAAGLLATCLFTRVIESSACTMVFLSVIRAAISAQNTLMIALPLVGMTAGIAGAAVGKKRCLVSAMAAAFNGAMLLLIVMLGI